MQFTLTVNASSPQELQKLLALITAAETTKYPPPLQPVAAPSLPSAPPTEPVKRGPGRPPKVEATPVKRDMEAAKAAVQVAAEAIKPEIAVPPTPPPVAAKPVNLKEQVMINLKNVNDTLGLPKAREILQSFNAQRISEIKESQYADFINACQLALD